MCVAIIWLLCVYMYVKNYRCIRCWSHHQSLILAKWTFWPNETKPIHRPTALTHTYHSYTRIAHTDLNTQHKYKWNNRHISKSFPNSPMTMYASRCLKQHRTIARFIVVHVVVFRPSRHSIRRTFEYSYVSGSDAQSISRAIRKMAEVFGFNSIKVWSLKWMKMK